MLADGMLDLASAQSLVSFRNFWSCHLNVLVLFDRVVWCSCKFRNTSTNYNLVDNNLGTN